MMNFILAIKRTFIRWGCLCSKRFKFRQICKAIGIKPLWWQKDFALSSYPILYISGGRRSGKTLAVILRALLYDGEPISLEDILSHDPDYLSNCLSRKYWYFNEYNKYKSICEQAGIPITPLFTNYSQFRV